MYDELLEALGIPGAPESTHKKITHDNFFYNKCLEALVESIAPSVAVKLNPLEKDALIKRYAASAPAPEFIPARMVVWIVGQALVSGDWFVNARFDRGGGMYDETYFRGTPAAMRGVKFRNE